MQTLQDHMSSPSALYYLLGSIAAAHGGGDDDGDDCELRVCRE